MLENNRPIGQSDGLKPIQLPATEQPKASEPANQASPLLRVVPRQFGRYKVATFKLFSEISDQPDGSVTVKPANSGGVVQAFNPLVEDWKSKGIQVDWYGQARTTSYDGADRALQKTSAERGFNLKLVRMPGEVHDGANRIANDAIWWILHGGNGLEQHARGKFDSLEDLAKYEEANKAFAQAYAEDRDNNTLGKIQDHHLWEVGFHLKALGVRDPLEHFTHTTFPDAKTFAHMPGEVRERFLRRMLIGFDGQGFQTPEDQEGFLDCVKEFVGDAEIISNNRGKFVRLDGQDHVATVFVNPISIETNEFNDYGRDPDVRRRIAVDRHQHRGQRRILVISRTDPMKGNLESLKALEMCYQLYPKDTVGALSATYVAAPSRLDLGFYRRYNDGFLEAADRINDTYGPQSPNEHWTPINVIPYSLDRKGVYEALRGHDIIAAFSKRDGMNLFLKEAAIWARPDAVVLASIHAGAGRQVPGFVQVDVDDPRDVAEKMRMAALMSPEERRERMRLARNFVLQDDIFAYDRRSMAVMSEIANGQSQTLKAV